MKKTSALHIHLLPVFLVAFSLFVYLFDLGLAELDTDEAKSALNIPYPHPPLIRRSMFILQHLFGFTEFHARLPVALIAVFATIAIYFFVKRLSERPYVAAWAALVFALIPAHLVYGRSGYTSFPVAAFWLLVLYGMLVAERKPQSEQGHWLIFIGLTLALWSGLQSILILPALAWWYLANRSMLSIPHIRMVFLLTTCQPILLFAYIIGSPLILADILKFSRSGAEQISSGPFSVMAANGLLPWVVGAIVLLFYFNFFFRKENGKELYLVASSILGAFVLLFMYSSPAAYYLPYLTGSFFLIAYRIIMTLSSMARTVTMMIILSVVLAHLPGIFEVPVHRQYYARNSDAIDSFLAEDEEVIVLGRNGYETWYYLPIPARDFPSDIKERHSAQHLYIPEPYSMSPEEKMFVENLEPLWESEWPRIYVNPDYHPEGEAPFSK